MNEQTIPTSLDECFEWLDKFLAEEDRTYLKDNERAPAALHFSFGMWMRNTWKLWEQGSPLHEHFAKMGLHHADDMSGLILDTYHRRLNDLPLRIEEEIKKYQEHWEKQATR